ncbi:MAG: rane-associated protein [Ilumatobacteraceae bacterium]|nr:rane-associated protein [Ilumatobacteraceae bacterium]
MIDVQHWLAAGGIAVLAAVVFAESGLLIGFFLPGDTLLFVAGFLSSSAGGHVLPALPVTAAVAFVSAAAGDQVGYLVGRRVGPGLFTRPRSRLFNPANAARAQAFFERRGPRAVVVARFIPVVRTFTPIVAGIGTMRYRTFVVYNLAGAALWGVGVTTLGYFLGEVQVIKNNLDYAALVILIVSFIPIALEYARHRRTVNEAH